MKIHNSPLLYIFFSYTLQVFKLLLKVYKEKAFEKNNLAPKVRLKNAKLLGENSLMFLVHPTLTGNEMNKSCQVLEQVFDQIEKAINQKNKQ
jgi:dTDP-4-amino-4,6-dideoxygalactose transaminase